MKKVLKIVAFILLIALAVASCYLMVQRTVEVVDFLKFTKDKMTEDAFKEDMQTRVKSLIFDIFPHLINSILLFVTAFSLYRGYSFEETKSEINVYKTRNREKKLKRLKSKIKEIESKIKEIEDDE